MSPSNSFFPANPSQVKYKAMYTFEATREDELTVTDGDVINVRIDAR
jgi:hypothetical protein